MSLDNELKSIAQAYLSMLDEKKHTTKRWKKKRSNVLSVKAKDVIIAMAKAII